MTGGALDAVAASTVFADSAKAVVSAGGCSEKTGVSGAFSSADVESAGLGVDAAVGAGVLEDPQKKFRELLGSANAPLRTEREPARFF